MKKQKLRMGLGWVLDRCSVTPSVLKETAFAVMSDTHILKSVQTMREIIAQAPGNAGAVTIIEKFFHE